MANTDYIENSNPDTNLVVAISDSDGTIVTTSLYAQLADIVEERHTWIELK